MEKKDRDYILSLFPTIVKIKDRDLREKVIQTWFNAWKRSNFLRIEDVHQFEPARERINYTNVDHTNQVCQACERMATIPSKILGLQLNLDYLRAGALLHDVDKMVVFDAQTGGGTEAGRRTPHAVAGASMARAEGLPEEVAHIIEAHSTKFSPHPPKSIEALILRHADLIVGNAVYMAQGLEAEKVLNESLVHVR
ncbi:MAG: HD domain-containing protein [Thermodesulfobacteriota bacterium]|jgi:putative nucleotidyltransferase with HDIG domain